MSRYVNLDQIMADIYEKWGCDPAYIANDTPTGIEARRDAELIELLRSQPSIDIVRCAECKFYNQRGSCFLRFTNLALIDKDNFCSCGRRDKANE